MKPTYKDAILILEKAWEGRKDAPDYPDYDDINTSIGVLKELVSFYYRKLFSIEVNYETRN